MTLACFSWVCAGSVPRRNAAGFTLIELLVVIGIVGLLLAILVPAVQSAREASRRVNCSNNMKQIALAIQLYHDARRVLPPAKYEYKYVDKAGRNCVNAHNIVTFLLPYMGYSAIYEKYTFSENWQNAKNKTARENAIPVLGCPSVPHSLVRPCRGSTTNGAAVIDFHITDYTTVERIALTKKDREKAGLFPKRQEPEYLGLLRTVDNEKKPFVSFLAAKDGLSQTFLLFESAGRPYKYQGRRRGDPEVTTKEPIGGARWADDDAAIWIKRTCGGGGQMTNCDNIQEIYAFHPGGTTTSFADGGVRFIAETMAPDIFVSLFTCAAGDTATPP